MIYKKTFGDEIIEFLYFKVCPYGLKFPKCGMSFLSHLNILTEKISFWLSELAN